MILGGPKYSTRFFDYSAVTRTFTVEESTLRANGCDAPSRLYDDACDEGFTLVSAKTGTEVMYYHEDALRDADGDILYWTYVEVDALGKINYYTRVIIYND